MQNIQGALAAPTWLHLQGNISSSLGLCTAGSDTRGAGTALCRTSSQLCQGLLMLWEPHVPSTHLLEMLEFLKVPQTEECPLLLWQDASHDSERWGLTFRVCSLFTIEPLAQPGPWPAVQFIQKTAASILEGALSIFTNSLQNTAPNAI